MKLGEYYNIYQELHKMGVTDVDVRPAPGQPGYFITSNGLLWSTASHKFLAPSMTKHGENFRHLKHNHNHTYCRLDWLVATTFLDRSDGCNFVWHKDGDLSNDEVSNLEWRKTIYGVKKKRGVETRKTPNGEKQPVVQMDKFGAIIAEYESATEASRKTGAKLAAISSVCNGFQKTAGGFFWKWAA